MNSLEGIKDSEKKCLRQETLMGERDGSNKAEGALNQEAVC